MQCPDQVIRYSRDEAAREEEGHFVPTITPREEDGAVVCVPVSSFLLSPEWGDGDWGGGSITVALGSQGGGGDPKSSILVCGLVCHARDHGAADAKIIQFTAAQPA